MCFAVVGSKAAKVHFLFFFSSFRKTEQAWKIKQSFLPPHPLFHLTQQFFLVHGFFFFLKKIPLQVLIKKKKIIKETGQNESMDDAGEGYWTGIRDWLDHGFGQKGREGGWFLSGITNLLPHKDHGRATDRGGCSVSTGILWTTVRCSDLKLCVAEGMS